MVLKLEFNINVDHVAMVLRFESEPDEVFIFESTIRPGVALQRWSNFRKYKNDVYDR